MVYEGAFHGESLLYALSVIFILPFFFLFGSSTDPNE